MILYIKSWCPWCIEAEKWLQSHGFDFQPVDVSVNQDAYSKMRRISGQSLTPTLEMPDGTVLADFDVKQLESFLRERKML